MISALEAENLIDRIAHRKQAGQSEKKNFVKMKGTHQQLEHKVSEKADANPNVGFKFIHYSVTESSGYVEITIVKKVP